VESLLNDAFPFNGGSDSDATPAAWLDYRQVRAQPWSSDGSGSGSSSVSAEQEEAQRTTDGPAAASAGGSSETAAAGAAAGQVVLAAAATSGGDWLAQPQIGLASMEYHAATAPYPDLWDGLLWVRTQHPVTPATV
jgi:hypothetical protein